MTQSRYLPGTKLRCQGCSFEGNPQQMSGHRRQSKGTCKQDPIVLSGGERHPFSTQPIVEMPSEETVSWDDENGMPAPQPGWAPTVVPPPVQMGDEGTLKNAPSFETVTPPPGKTVPAQIPVPPVGKRMVALNPKIYLLYNAAQARWHYDRTFDEFIEEGMELLFEFLGYQVAIVPAEWVSAAS